MRVPDQRLNVPPSVCAGISVVPTISFPQRTPPWPGHLAYFRCQAVIDLIRYEEPEQRAVGSGNREMAG